MSLMDALCMRHDFSAKSVISSVVKIIMYNMFFNFFIPMIFHLSKDKKLQYNQDMVILCVELN
jgi:hypothetical protein